MNNLHRDIEKGEVVVVAARWMKAEFKTLDKRLFKCDGGGFGCRHSAIGRAVYGIFLATGEQGRLEGDMIDRAETIAYQSKHGKFGKGETENVQT